MSNNRQSYKCPIFGTIEDIKENVLPTYQDVMKCYEWNRLQVKIKNNSKKEPAFSEIAEIVTQKVEGVWQKASIPVVSHTRVIQLLKAYHSKCKNIIKSLKRLSTEKKNEFLQQSEILFDICSCKCKIISQCNCPREVKVPKEEHVFLIDQRSERKMRIGGIDRNRTKSLQKKFVRKQASTKICLKSDNNQYKMPEQELMLSISSDSDTSVSFPENLHKNIEEPLPSSSGTMENKKCVKSLPVLSQICDRYGVSDRAGAAIASAVLHELSSDIVIDKSKLRRERRKTRDELMKNEAPLNLPALYFDGRKDKTLRIVKKGSKRYKQVVIEEHVSVIKEPESIYVGYVTPLQGTAKTIEISINALLSAKNISTDDLLAIGCDGTVTNTGNMCILFVHNGSNIPESDYRLIIASNRDEFLDRPASNIASWEEDPSVFGGRDLVEGCGGGTWLAICPLRKKVAALLNLPTGKKPDAKTRGKIVADFVKCNEPATKYIDNIKEYAAKCNHFNLVAIDLSSPKIQVYNNLTNEIKTLYDTEFGISNSLPYSPLKKVEAGKQKFEEICKKYNKIGDKTQLVEKLLALLGSKEQHLPDPELELNQPVYYKEFSSICVSIPEIRYGTRTHTVVLVTKTGHVGVIEVTLEPPMDFKDPKWLRSELQFDLES